MLIDCLPQEEILPASLSAIKTHLKDRKYEETLKEIEKALRHIQEKKININMELNLIKIGIFLSNGNFKKGFDELYKIKYMNGEIRGSKHIIISIFEILKGYFLKGETIDEEKESNIIEELERLKNKDLSALYYLMMSDIYMSLRNKNKTDLYRDKYQAVKGIKNPLIKELGTLTDFRSEESSEKIKKYYSETIKNNNFKYIEYKIKGDNEIRRGHLEEALPFLIFAKKLIKNLELKGDLQMINSSLAEAYFHLNNKKFSSTLDECMTYFEENGNEYLLCKAELLKAESLRMSDFVKEAEEIFLKTFQKSANQKFQDLEILSLVGLGDTYRITSRIKESYAHYNKALTLISENSIYDSSREEGLCYRGIGLLDLQTGTYNLAERNLLEALKKSSLASDMINIAKTLISLGRVNLALAEFGKARSQYEKSLKIAQDLKNLWLEVQVLTYLADVERMMNHNPNARILYIRTMEIAEKINDRSKYAMAKFGVAVIDKFDRKYGEALESLNEVKSIYMSISHQQGIAMTLTSLPVSK